MATIDKLRGTVVHTHSPPSAGLHTMLPLHLCTAVSTRGLPHPFTWPSLNHSPELSPVPPEEKPSLTPSECSLTLLPQYPNLMGGTLCPFQLLEADHLPFHVGRSNFKLSKCKGQGVFFYSHELLSYHQAFLNLAFIIECQQDT